MADHTVVKLWRQDLNSGLSESRTLAVYCWDLLPTVPGRTWPCLAGLIWVLTLQVRIIARAPVGSPEQRASCSSHRTYLLVTRDLWAPHSPGGSTRPTQRKTHARESALCFGAGSPSSRSWPYLFLLPGTLCRLQTAKEVPASQCKVPGF